MPSKNRTMITLEELSSVWGNANFGESRESDRMKLVKWGLMQINCEYSTGHTMWCILIELGLVTPKGNVTKRGKYCLWEFFRDQYRKED